jgi:hypothetical protein
MTNTEETVIGILLGIASFILPEVLNNSNIDPVFFLVIVLSILILNILFEYIHSIKRSYLDENDKLMTKEIFHCTAISFLTFVIQIEIFPEVILFNYLSFYIISIIIGYFIVYCRIRGKKYTIVTIFSSKKDLLKKKEIYRLEMIHDKDKYSKLDLYVIYGYITMKQLEDAKIITDSKDEDTIITGLRALSILTDDSIWEVNYAYNYYKEHKVLLDNDSLEDRLKRKRKLIKKSN